MTRQRVELYFRVLFVLMGTLAAILSLKTYISDSEFWAITASRQLGEFGVSASIYMKFLFYGLLKPIYLLPLDNISHVLVARLEFAVIAAFTAFVFYRVAKLSVRDELGALVLTLLLVSCSFYLSQSFRVRSDNMASLIALVVLWIVIPWSRRTDGKWILHAAAVAVLNLLLLIATPKSFYFLLIGAAFTSTLPFASLDRGKKLLGVTMAFVMPPFLIVAAIELAGSVPSFRWIQRAFRTAIEYFLDSFSGLSGPNSYLTSADFIHVVKLIEQNPIHDSIFVASLVLWVRFWRKLPSDRLAYGVLFLFASAMLVLHNQKLPFFIYAILPCLILGAGYSWKAFWPRLLESSRFIPALAITLSLCLVTAARATFHSLTENGNDLQLATLRPLQAFIKEERIENYYDAIGLFPRLNRIFAFPSPNDRNNSVIMTVVRNAKPDLFLYVTRSLELEPALAFFLGDSYVDIGGGAWLRAVQLKKLKASKDASGECGMAHSELGPIARERLGGDRVKLFEFDSTGFVSLIDPEIDLAKEGWLRWPCEGKSLALSTIRPRALSRKLDLRFLFGFDSNY